MKIPNIDESTEEDIIHYIKEIAPSYTPEWRLNKENPDVGTALGLIYAEMMADTIKQFNRVPEKNMLSFFHMLGTKLLPAIPATGYITMNLVDGAIEGAEVKRGTQVIANVVEEDGSMLTFETTNDLYVTPAKLKKIFFADRKRDQLYLLYEEERFLEKKEMFHLFDEKGKNLQEHVIWIGDDSTLFMEGAACVTVTFKTYHVAETSNERVEPFLNTENVEISYLTEKGFCPFARRTLSEGKLLLWKESQQPKSICGVQQEQEAFWIRFIIKNIEGLENFFVNEIWIRSEGREILPEFVYADEMEQKVRKFLPFGERFTEFSEVYLASQEVLSKKNAWIEMTFDLDFVKVPLESSGEQEAMDWKVIMKQEAFKLDEEYDITIHSILWEYYNGFGWKRLFVNNQYSDIFNAKHGIQQNIGIQFQCPEDIEPFLVNSLYSFYIRARVIRVNNAFKIKGSYLSPIMSQVQFRYEYGNDGNIPKNIVAMNNRELTYDAKNQVFDQKTWIPFITELEQEKGTLYLGFDEAPVEGPIKILFSMKDIIMEETGRLQFEYYGNKQWKTLHAIDETEGFKKTGLLTLIGNHDFEQWKLFGENLYWIRIIDAEGYYSNTKQKVKLPCVEGIYINSTQIIAAKTQTEENFFMEPNQKNAVFELLNKQVYKAEVWVNEQKEIDRRELLKIEKEYKVKYEYNQDGELDASWVLWQEVEDFSVSKPMDRHYKIDKIMGILGFSDGKNGQIPSSGRSETIKVLYSCGGGRCGNLEPKSITRMNQSIGFINYVNNEEYTTGGCNQETIEEALKRASASLKHGYRAVTTEDYEVMALEATRNIWKAKCFSNCNALGEKQYGCITLVLLQKDFMKGRKYFDTVREQVMTYLQHKIVGNVASLKHFYVTEPQFLEMNVSVTLAVEEFNQVFEARKEALYRLYDFLDPMNGNFDKKGWEIGTLPNKTQILNIVKDIKQVHYVKSIRITAYHRGTHGMVEVDLENSENNGFALALNGKHEIFIEIG
ncbi:MAG: baseplate J/gp47 family protein [Acetivibrio sp.]